MRSPQDPEPPGFAITTDHRNRKDIPARVRFARERAGLTQEALARELGISVRTMGNYERESGTPIPAHLVAEIEEISKLPPGWILVDGPFDDDDPEVRAHWLRTLGGTLSVVASLVVLLFPTGANAAADRICECVVVPSARQPRFKLAHRSPRRTHPRGRRTD